MPSQICLDTMIWVACASIKIQLGVKHCSFCFIFLGFFLFYFLLLLFFVFNFLKILTRWIFPSMMFLQPLIWQQWGLAEPFKAFYLSNWFPLENFQQNTIFLSSTDVFSSLVYMTSHKLSWVKHKWCYCLSKSQHSHYSFLPERKA